PDYEGPNSTDRYDPKSHAAVNPHAYRSSREAAAECGNAGKRLRSLEERFRACLAREQTTDAYGTRYEAGSCNAGEKHDLARRFGKNPMHWTYDHFNDPDLIKKGYLAAAGEHAQCTNAYGTHDMVGNLHEWVADRVDETLPDKIPLTPPIRRSVSRKHGYGTFLGRYFGTGRHHGRGREF